MIITQISIESILSGLAGNGDSAGLASESQSDIDFGSIIQNNGCSTLDSGNQKLPVAELLNIKGIKNSELSAQIKNALVTGEKVSLKLDNPKDILATLLKISSGITTETPLENSGVATENINIENILESLQINDVVVDNQQISQLLEEFVSNLKVIINDTIERAKEKEVPNIEEVSAVIAQICNDLIIQVNDLSDTKMKEIDLDLSKVKLILQEAQLESSDQGTDSVKAKIILRGDSPDNKIILTVSGNKGEVKIKEILLTSEPAVSQIENNLAAKKHPETIKLDPARTQEIKQDVSLEIDPELLKTELKKSEIPAPIDQKPAEIKKVSGDINIDRPKETETSQVKIIINDESVSLSDLENISNKETAVVSAVKNTRDILSPVIEKVLDLLNLKKVPDNNREVVVKVNPQSQINSYELKANDNLLENINMLQKIVPESLEKLEVKITPDLQQIQTLKETIKNALDTIKTVLNKEVVQIDSNKINVEKLQESLKVNLDSIISTVKNIDENNKLEIILPRLFANLNSTAPQRQIVNLQGQNLVEADLKALKNMMIEMETQRPQELPVKEKATGESTQKPVPSQIDRSINLNKLTLNTPVLSQTRKMAIEQPMNLKPAKLEATHDKPATIATPETSNANINQTQALEFSNKNVFNMLLSKTNDPALAGVKINNGLFATNNIGSFIHSSANLSADSIVNQVIDRIRSNFNKNELSISLRPNNLGNVNVNISLEKGILVANIVAETAKAAESLRQGIDSLKQVMTQNGLNVERIVVSTVENTNTAHNNHSNNDTQQNSNKENMSNNNQNNQQEKFSSKEGLDLGQNKQSNGKNATTARLDTQNPEALNNENTDQTTTSNTEENYIDTDKGIVNYRV